MEPLPDTVKEQVEKVSDDGFDGIVVYVDEAGQPPVLNAAGYQTIAKYHAGIDAVVIQFPNTFDFEGYNWSLPEVMYNRII